MEEPPHYGEASNRATERTSLSCSPPQMMVMLWVHIVSISATLHRRSQLDTDYEKEDTTIRRPPLDLESKNGLQVCNILSGTTHRHIAHDHERKSNRHLIFITPLPRLSLPGTRLTDDHF